MDKLLKWCSEQDRDIPPRLFHCLCRSRGLSSTDAKTFLQGSLTALGYDTFPVGILRNDTDWMKCGDFYSIDTVTNHGENTETSYFRVDRIHSCSRSRACVDLTWLYTEEQVADVAPEVHFSVKDVGLPVFTSTHHERNYDIPRDLATKVHVKRSSCGVGDTCLWIAGVFIMGNDNGLETRVVGFESNQ